MGRNIETHVVGVSAGTAKDPFLFSLLTRRKYFMTWNHQTSASRMCVQMPLWESCNKDESRLCMESSIDMPGTEL